MKRLIIEEKVEGKRSKGRSPARWVDQNKSLNKHESAWCRKDCTG